MQPTDCPVAHLQLAQIQFYLLARLQIDLQLATAMGAGTFKTQITTIVDQIAVQPAPELNNSKSSNTDGDQSTVTPSRGSRRSSPSSPMQASRQRQVGSARRGGGIPRPIYIVSDQQWSGRGYPMHSRSGGRAERLKSGLLFHHEMDHNDLNTSQKSQRRVNHFFQEISSSESDVIFLQIDSSHTFNYPSTCCQLCGNQFANIGLQVPLFLLCGHSYCKSCLEKACNSCNYPVALKCGICSIITPLDQFNPDNLPENKAILDLISSKEYNSITSEKNHPDSCAECVHRMACMYCSECSASYCDLCGEKAHKGSRVRSRHKPVPINLKPSPHPTCKKHSGQSCMLYCETEKQPMCVLCKFYNQHRFHKFELLRKVASKYTSSVSAKLTELERLEKKLGSATEYLYASVSDINGSAKKVQERLEKHFAEMRKNYLAALERREAMLLSLVDRQVDVKQEILAEMRLEVAASRTRILAAQEEASKILLVNPVTTLLNRRHMDISFEHALKQTITTPLATIRPDVPISLLPDISLGQLHTVSQHGAILQLPPRLQFNSVVVTISSILLNWEMQDQNLDVSSDRTIMFSLHCYRDIPDKSKSNLTFKNKLIKTPESGFDEMSELSSESKYTFPSLPPSLICSRNITLMTQQDLQEIDNQSEQTEKVEEHSHHNDMIPGLLLKPTRNKTLSTFIPESIRLPKKREELTVLPQLVGFGASPHLATVGEALTTAPDATSGRSMLNLPPLVVDKLDIPIHMDSLQSVNTSGVYEDMKDRNGNSPHMSTVDESKQSDQQKSSQTDSTSSSSSLSITSTGLRVTKYTDLGRFCADYVFEEIYCGDKGEYSYLGVITGGSYYFRVRCHNAAGWGPWSDTVHCTTSLH